MQKLGVNSAKLGSSISGSSKSFDQWFASLQNGNKLTADQKSALEQLYNAFHGTTAGAAGAAVAVSKLAAEAQQSATQLKNLTNAVVGLGDAQLGLAQSADQVKDAIHTATTETKQYGTSLDANTVKGRANQEAFLSALQAIKSYANTQSQAHVPISKVTQDMESNVRALEDQAVKAGFSRKAVQDLIAEMHLTPKQIETKFILNTGDAIGQAKALRTYLEQKFGTAITQKVDLQQINSKQAALDQHVQSQTGTNPLNSIAKYKPHALGGLIRGAGSGTSDSIVARLSNGEYVEPADVTARYRPLLDALRNGTPPAAAGKPPVTVQINAQGMDAENLAAASQRWAYQQWALAG